MHQILIALPVKLFLSDICK